MTHDPLADLLRDADAAAPPPPVTAGLAAVVYRKAARRKQRRRIAVGACTGVCVVALAWSWTQLTPVSPTQRVEAAIDLREVSRLRAEASLHLKVAEALIALDRRRGDRSRLLEPALTIESEREKAALALVDHGDRLRRDLKQSDAALAAYRRTIELFPDTRWAAVARQRIAQLKPDAAAPQQLENLPEALS